MAENTDKIENGEINEGYYNTERDKILKDYNNLKKSKDLENVSKEEKDDTVKKLNELIDKTNKLLGGLKNIRANNEQLDLKKYREIFKRVDDIKKSMEARKSLIEKMNEKKQTEQETTEQSKQENTDSKIKQKENNTKEVENNGKKNIKLKKSARESYKGKSRIDLINKKMYSKLYNIGKKIDKVNSEEDVDKLITSINETIEEIEKTFESNNNRENRISQANTLIERLNQKKLDLSKSEPEKKQESVQEENTSHKEAETKVEDKSEDNSRIIKINFSKVKEEIKKAKEHTELMETLMGLNVCKEVLEKIAIENKIELNEIDEIKKLMSEAYDKYKKLSEESKKIYNYEPPKSLKDDFKDDNFDKWEKDMQNKIKNIQPDEREEFIEDNLIPKYHSGLIVYADVEKLEKIAKLISNFVDSDVFMKKEKNQEESIDEYDEYYEEDEYEDYDKENDYNQEDEEEILEEDEEIEEEQIDENSKEDEETKEDSEFSKIIEEYNKRLNEAKTAKDYKKIYKEVQSKLKDLKELNEADKQKLEDVEKKAYGEYEKIHGRKLTDLLSEYNRTTSEFNKLKNEKSKRDRENGISELNKKVENATENFNANKTRKERIEGLKKKYKDNLDDLKTSYGHEIDLLDNEIDKQEKIIIDKDIQIDKQKREQKKLERSREFKKWKKNLDKLSSDLTMARLNNDTKQIDKLEKAMENAYKENIVVKYANYNSEINRYESEKKDAEQIITDKEQERRDKEIELSVRIDVLKSKLENDKSIQEQAMVKQTFLSRTIGRIGSIVDRINVGKRFKTITDGLETGIKVISDFAKDVTDNVAIDIKDKIDKRTKATQQKIDEYSKQQETPENENEKNKEQQSKLNEKKSEDGFDYGE